MRFGMIALTVTFFGTAGCGSVLPEPPCDTVPAHGVCIGLDPEYPPKPPPLDSDRWTYALEKSAEWWGLYYHQMKGVQIGLSAQPIECGKYGPRNGCESGGIIWLYVFEGDPCPEWFLPHEMGHVAIGDEYHKDPRFKDAHLAIRDLPGCEPWE
jgi:hypothetical protein